MRGGGGDVGKLAACHVPDEEFLAHAVDDERGQHHGMLPWRMLSSRSLTGPAKAGMERTMRTPRRNRMMSATPMPAPRASSRGAALEKHRRSPHRTHVPSQAAVVKNVAR